MLSFAFASALALAPSPSASPTTVPHEEPAAREQPPTSEPPALEEPTVPLADALVVRPGATCLESARLVSQIRTWFDHERIDERLVVEVVGDATLARKLAFTIRRGEQVIAVRRFDPAPDRCADLHAVVGLAIALAIDATLLESVAGDPTKVPPDPPLRPKEDPNVPEKPKPKPTPKPRSWRLWAEVAGVVSLGAPPDVGGGARVAFGTSWRRIIDLGLGAVVTTSGQQTIGEGSALLTLAAGRFDLCAGPPWVRLRPRGCVGVIAGEAFADGEGFDRDQSAQVPYVSIPFGVDLEVKIASRVGLLFGVEGLPVVVRPTFEADSGTGTRAVRRFASFGAMFEAGFTFLLW